MSEGNGIGRILGFARTYGGNGSPADPEAIQAAVEQALEDHPEWTTTVQDGSITKAKLDSNLSGAIDDVSDLKSANQQRRCA